MELFIPARDGQSQGDSDDSDEVEVATEATEEGPTWEEVSDAEEEVPVKPRPITKTELKRAQVKAQILAGTRTTIIMETRGSRE